MNLGNPPVVEVSIEFLFESASSEPGWDILRAAEFVDQFQADYPDTEVASHAFIEEIQKLKRGTDPVQLVKNLPVAVRAFPADRSRIIVAYDPHDAWQDWCWWSECAITAKSATPLIDIGGGTLVVPLHDSWRYPAPPLDGWSMLDRDLGVVPANLGSTSAIATPPVYPRPNLELATAYEYVHASGSYFLTTRADEIDALDSGRLPGWRRTGESFLLWARALDAGSRLPASAPGTAQASRRPN